MILDLTSHTVAKLHLCTKNMPIAQSHENVKNNLSKHYYEQNDRSIHWGMGKKYKIMPSRFFLSNINEIEIAANITTHQPQV